MQQKQSKLLEGLQDILSLASQQLAKQEESGIITQDQRSEAGSSEKSEFEIDTIVHTIISKFFKLQRSFDNSIMEFKHQLDVGRLEAENAENLKFDLEILTEEKLNADLEIDSLQETIKQLKQALSDQHEKLSEE